MLLSSFHRLGHNAGTPRIWLETKRLERLGFRSGTAFKVESTQRRVTLSICDYSRNRVSSRRINQTERPIIDICAFRSLAPLIGYDELNITGKCGRLDITPSVRAFHIQRGRLSEPPFRVVEFFAGGGTLSKAYSKNPLFTTVAGLEIDPNFSDIWQDEHPDALLIDGDLRLIHPSEIPDHDILVCGIPCTDHSGMGRAKKSLAGKPESGEAGDLFLDVISHIVHHLPSACVFENVPNYANSVAGISLKRHLARLGYHVFETMLEPNTEWNEPSDRKRWLLVATLRPGFLLVTPKSQFSGSSRDFLDPADPVLDQSDAGRIAGTISALRAHNARHAALGHGFAFTTLNGSESKIPTIPKSYHKINTGPFVETPFGPRLLRRHEVEKIMGSTTSATHYATAIQILGQGVQTRIFREVFSQLGEFLAKPHELKAGTPIEAKSIPFEPCGGPPRQQQLELV